MSYEDSKYLGGDVAHTHLVKGLDFALLHKAGGRAGCGWESGRCCACANATCSSCPQQPVCDLDWAGLHQPQAPLTTIALFPSAWALQVRAEQEASKRGGAAGGESDVEEAPSLAMPVVLPVAATPQPVSGSAVLPSGMLFATADTAAVRPVACC